MHSLKSISYACGIFFKHGNHKRDCQAFSLIELLTVVLLMTLMAVLSLPALSSLRQAGAVNQAIFGISLQLEQARAYAMAHNTYVWVGFAGNTTSKTLTVQAVAGTTGESTDLQTGATYMPLAPAKNYENLILQSVAGIAGVETADDVLSSNLSSFTQIRNGTMTTYTTVLQYSPSGQVTIKQAGNISRRVQIGLQPSAGSSVQKNNAAALQVGGLTGQVLVFRP